MTINDETDASNPEKRLKLDKSIQVEMEHGKVASWSDFRDPRRHSEIAQSTAKSIGRHAESSDGQSGVRTPDFAVIA